ncbi:LOW QUALITY PROTEIN: polyunsaturated fatty acid 5-lipoxygenase-like [Pollicipes pollicipes]|uniref:LOW QUALITY PROTEIN: polyunsaturated fatty acid 5-lipoxygenase-like n=1 Tax=Pollicipes pollicipes TaxID=41117 RepID=UPI00188552F6|nr:LOW QUALITY PROTEIN: polyunsaturated fatty acid 5-lipoxygenase-like [Pollicipes pollicipes]
MGNVVPKLTLYFSRDRFVIHVHTGDRKAAGTDANVYVQLRDSAGHVTAPRRLDHWLFNDLERGTVCQYPFPADPELKDVDSIVLRRDGAGLGDAWFLDLVEVEDRQVHSKWVFPVHRWIQTSTEYRIKQHGISLPQDDEPDMLANRQGELAKKQEAYEYTQRIEDGPAQIKDLPEDEMFSFSYKFDFLKEKARLLLKTSTIGSSTNKWASFAELMKAYQNSLGEPAAMQFWSTDRWFGLQRVQGVNPVMITLCDAIPDKMGVDEAMLKPFLEDLTLDEALRSNKIFIVDLHMLEGIEPVENTQLCSPIALFYLNKSDELMPLAIQLFQNKGPDNPVFLPSDPPNLWLLAKMFYNNAEAQQHQSCTHLGFTHLLMEGVVICTHRNLSPSHPVFRLVAPHFLYLIAINSRGLEKLISPGGWVDKGMTVGVNGMFDLIRRGIKTWRMDTLGIVPKQVASRGVLDRAVLPYYPYRDDACALYAALERYVRAVVSMVYSSPERLKDDWELQQWRRELTRPRDKGGVGLLGVPGDDETGFTDVSQVVDVVTCVVAACSLGHAAANFAQYEEYGFVPNYPGILYGNAPNSKEAPEPTEDDLMSYLPNRVTSRDIMVITKLLSYRGTQSLGDFEVRYMYDPVGSEAAETLRAELRALSETIAARNATAEYPYPWLDPAFVPNSISV